MKMTKVALAALAPMVLVAPHAATAAAGDVQVKLLGTAVLPDGKITQVKIDPGLPAGTDTRANDNVVPTLAIEYFVTGNVSLETICCLTQHDVDASSGALAGAELVADAKILPATLTAKYHLPVGGIKPYIGAGVTYFVFIDEKPGAGSVAALGATRQKMNDKFGFVLQAGVDVPLDSAFGISLDAKRYFLKTDATWYDSTGAAVLRTRHTVDPWVLSAGVAYTF